MRPLVLTGPDAEIDLAGILDPQPTPDGLLLRRLPAWTRDQVVDLSLAFTTTLPSGGRIELVTDATTIEIEALCTRLALGADLTRPAPFDLVIDGTIVATADADDGPILRITDPETLAVELTPGTSSTVRFSDLTPGTKRIEAWLPHMASVTLVAVRVDPSATATRPVPGERRRWVHYGSSISHCIEARRPTEVWPAVVARDAGLDLTSLAIAGQAHLDQFAARTIRDLDVDLISLKVGINIVNGDTLRERTFVPAVHGFLDTIRDGHPDTPLLLVSPIICPIVEDAPGPTGPGADGMVTAVPRPAALADGALTLARIRELLTQVVSSRADPALVHLDGRSLFGPDDAADLYDRLHPTADGYLLMAQRFSQFAFGANAPFGPT